MLSAAAGLASGTFWLGFDCSSCGFVEGFAGLAPVGFILVDVDVDADALGSLLGVNKRPTKSRTFKMLTSLP